MHASLLLFGCSVFAVSIAFRNLIELVTIRVSVYKAFFCSSRSLDGISRYISVNFLFFFAVNLNAQLNQFNCRNVEIFRNQCTYSRPFDVYFYVRIFCSYIGYPVNDYTLTLPMYS